MTSFVFDSDNYSDNNDDDTYTSSHSFTTEEVDEITTSTSSSTSTTATCSGSRVRKILGLISPSDSGDLAVAAEWAAVLAVSDFNNRSFMNSSSVSSLSSSSCDFQLSLELHAYSGMFDLARIYQEYVLFPQADAADAAVDEDSNNNNTNSHPVAVLGSLSSEGSTLLATLGATSASDACGSVINISPLASSIELDDRQQYPYFARTMPSNKAEIVALCHYLNHIGVRNLLLLYDSQEYGMYYYVAASQVTAHFNIQLVAYSLNDDPNDILETLQTVKSMPIRYGLCAMPYNNWFPLLNALHELGMIGPTHQQEQQQQQQYAWFFSNSLSVLLGIHGNNNNDPDFARQYGTILNQTALITIQPPPDAIDVQTKRFERASQDSEFLKYWKASTKFLDHHPQQHQHQHQHDYNSNVSEPLQVVLVQVPNASLVSLLTYDAVMAIGHAACLNNNETDFSPAKLYRNFRGLAFQGASGYVELDNHTATRRPEHMTYVIQNVLFSQQGELTLVPSVLIPMNDPTQPTTTTTMIQEPAPLIFQSGSSFPPHALLPLLNPPVILGKASGGVMVFLCILAAIAVGFSIFCAVWTLTNRKRPRVLASQPELLVCLCCGTLLVGMVCVLATLKKPSSLSQSVLDASCTASVWCYCMGFTTICAANFARMWRIHRVYRNARKFRRVTVRVLDVIWPLLLLLGLNVAILTAWTVIDAPTYNEHVLSTDIYGRPTVVMYSCFYMDNSEDSVTSIVCISLLLVICVIALVLLNYQSYRSRNLPSQFNESYYIAITNLMLLEAIIIFVPLQILVHKIYHVASGSLLCFVICMAVLIPTFVPKFQKRENNNNHNNRGTIVSGLTAAATDVKPSLH